MLDSKVILKSIIDPDSTCQIGSKESGRERVEIRRDSSQAEARLPAQEQGNLVSFYNHIK